MKKLLPILKKTLLGCGFLFLILGLRMYFLAVIRHDYFVVEARKPKRKMRLIHPQRGNILDRKGTPLAINKTQYNVAILYSDIRSIPWVGYEVIKGKKQKIYPRKHYVEQLATFISNTCALDKEWIQDEIFAKAALLPTHPHPIKLDLSEKEFAICKLAEKDYPGLIAEQKHKRFYPNGKTASHILGYLGHISQTEYTQIVNEIRTLESFINMKKLDLDIDYPQGYSSFQEVESRLSLLKQKAYTTRDFVGKAGVEKTYDEMLRGFAGIDYFEADVFGNVKVSLSQSKQSVKGKDIRLSILLELQEYAEKELAMLENTESGQYYFDEQSKTIKPLQVPYIKGSSLLVMDPKTSEIYAFASYPRFDPNDFVEHNTSQIYKWLESSKYKQDLFLRKARLEKECLIQDKMIEVQKVLNLNTFLHFLLPHDHPLFAAFAYFNTLQKIVHLQTTLDLLCKEYQLEKKTLLMQKDLLPRSLQQFCLSDYDTILFCDLLALLCHHEAIDHPMLAFLQERTLEEHLQDAKEYSEVFEAIRPIIRALFKETVFSRWREAHFTQFLKEKRKEEKEHHLYVRPYTDYLEKEERKQFNAFWQIHKTDLINHFLLDTPLEATLEVFKKALLVWKKEIDAGAHLALEWVKAFTHLKKTLKPLPCHIAKKYLLAFREFNELEHIPLIGTYPQLSNKASLSDLAFSFYPKFGFGFTKHMGYQEPIMVGSVFKLVTTYCFLFKQYFKKAPIDSPMVLFDAYRKDPMTQKWTVAKNNKNEPIYQMYKGGRLIKSQKQNIGWVNLQGAIEASSNPYFSILAKDHIQNPLLLYSVAKSFGFSRPTGIDLPFEKQGQMPMDLFFDPSSLYSFAIGQNVLATNLQAAILFSAIANKGRVYAPRVVCEIEGKEPNLEIIKFMNNIHYPHKALLKLANVHFPLLLNTKQIYEDRVQSPKKEQLIKTEIPKEIQEFLLQGMRQVVTGQRGTCFFERVPSKAFKQLKDQIYCKTSSSEVVLTNSFDENQHGKTYKHTWLGVIYYEKNEPKLVIVINNKYGRSGRSLAPIAARIIEKFKSLSLN